jgi:hypothetical protein
VNIKNSEKTPEIVRGTGCVNDILFATLISAMGLEAARANESLAQANTGENPKIALGRGAARNPGHRRESQSRVSAIIVFALPGPPGGPEIFDIAICTPLTTVLHESVVASFFQEAFTCDMYQSPTVVRSSVDWN